MTPQTPAISQMLLFGWQTKTQATALTDEFAAGGVILMGRNVGTPEETAAQITKMQARAAELGLPPLFVAVDQEGGRVQRLAPPRYPARPSAREIGQSGDAEVRARAEAASLGRELKELGFNWDFAPVLDVDNNPDNPVIGNRSYSPDPERVAALGIEAVRGLQEDAGILACGKHFPGHGDTNIDSHLALPRIPHSRARLESVEMVPFRAAVAAGLGAVMTSHILFPAIDPDLPATLSPAILTGLLRQQIGFDGLIITDDLEMRGIADHWGAGEAAVLTVLAGADLVLCCHTYSAQQAITAALTDAAASGRISAARLQESLARIARAKTRWVS